eukprot:1077969-Prymnesium_polylepis.1
MTWRRCDLRSPAASDECGMAILCVVPSYRIAYRRTQARAEPPLFQQHPGAARDATAMSGHEKRHVASHECHWHAVKSGGTTMSHSAPLTDTSGPVSLA